MPVNMVWTMNPMFGMEKKREGLMSAIDLRMMAKRATRVAPFDAMEVSAGMMFDVFLL